MDETLFALFVDGTWQAPKKLSLRRADCTTTSATQRPSPNHWKRILPCAGSYALSAMWVDASTRLPRI